MKELIIQILTALIQLLVVFGLGSVLKLLKEKVGQEKMKNYYDVAKTAIQFAEQVIGSGNGERKKDMAIQYISQKLGGKLTPKEIDVLLEAVLYESINQFKEFKLEK